MFLVKFRATEKISWIPNKAKSMLIEEYINTEDEGYARLRAHQELEKSLQDYEDYNIELYKVEKIKVIN